MVTSPKPYDVHVPGLDEVVKAVRPPDSADGKHSALLAAIRKLPSLEGARLVTERGDKWLSRRKVLTATGELVHSDYDEWLRAECVRGDGDVRATWRRLQSLGHQLSECSLTDVYVACDRAGAREDDYVQLKVCMETEYIDRRLFDPQVGWGLPPDNVADLLGLAEQGPRLGPETRELYSPPIYRLRQTIDVARFVADAEALDAHTRATQAARVVTVSIDAGPSRTMTAGELMNRHMGGSSESRQQRWKGRRLFDDWTLSSAGRSGARLSDHWAIDLTDWTNPHSGERVMGLIPLWAYMRPLAKVDRPGLSDYALYSKLETLDRRVKVPFAWYFYMLHGNRVQDWAGHRVIRAAEAGTIVLPEHDYRVLKAWEDQPYGF